MPRHAGGSAQGATFTISAARCPQVLCRLLGLFAQQDILLDRVDATAASRTLRVTLCAPDLDTRRATIIAEKMRQLVKVRTVRFRAGLRV